MKHEIDIQTWNRKDHFLFFSQFEEPFFGVTFTIDCTAAYARAKAAGHSFFLHYLYRALKAANAIEAFRYRIEGQRVYLFNEVNVATTVNRPDGTFGFGYMNYHTNEHDFYRHAEQEIARTRNSSGLQPSGAGDNVIHFSALPWVNFTSLSHARMFRLADSCPKISFGKMTEANGHKTMPVSVHVHHGLADGYHVGLFAEQYQTLMSED